MSHFVCLNVVFLTILAVGICQTPGSLFKILFFTDEIKPTEQPFQPEYRDYVDTENEAIERTPKDSKFTGNC